MMKQLTAALVFLLLPHFAEAQRSVEIIETDPPIVRELQPFDLLIRGFWSSGDKPAAPEVRIDGDSIAIIMTNTIDASALTEPWGTRVRVGGLPAERYTITVVTDGEVVATEDIDVLPGSFAVVPPFGQAGTDVLIEDIPLNSCSGPLICSTLQVLFGGVPATEVSVTGDMDILAKAPAGNGIVEVTVRGYDGRTHTLADAFTYGPGGSPEDYERVLFPMAFAGPGAHGSQWRSENIVRNDAPVAVPTEPVFEHGLAALAPRSRATIPETREDAGAFLWVARGAEKWLTYSSHIVDRSRSGSDRGSELPVVHSADTSAEIRLIDIPLRPRYRARLRIYDYDIGMRRNITITVTRDDGTQHGIRRELADPLGPCVGPCIPHSPAMVSVDLSAIPELANAGEVDISVRAETLDARLWAFVSISNNETQHVTMYTPQHAGIEVIR